MRSLCRRLMAEQGKELGLVMIDYLQLMEGSGSDNRVQELSRICLLYTSPSPRD